MICQMDVEKRGGRWVHTCRVCGTVRTADTPGWVRECSGMAPNEVTKRLATCRPCAERPEGCWKAQDYGCTRDYQAAARQAAATKSCPLGKLR